MANKSPEVVRIYLPPDGNCLLSVADHCLKSTNYVNVMIADKQVHQQYLDMEEAIAHCEKGLGIWDWASNDQGGEPDVVMASCGDVPTIESLAATALLRKHLPDVKVRFVNVVDLFKLVPHTEHPHGLTDREFEAVFTSDKPVVFNFHGYPWLIHRLTYRRPGQHHLHVRGYKEQGNINTPLELAIRNQTDRFSLAIDAIDRMPRFRVKGASAREALLNQQIKCKEYAHEFGVDQPEDQQLEVAILDLKSGSSPTVREGSMRGPEPSHGLATANKRTNAMKIEKRRSRFPQSQREPTYRSSSSNTAGRFSLAELAMRFTNGILSSTTLWKRR